MQRRSSNLTRQLLGDPRPTTNPWRSPYLGWRVRPHALIRTRSPSASEWAESINAFVSVLTSLDIFDCFRALLTPEDRERRNPSALTPRQREYLDRWGYPYVMEDFRFHMTLTGRLDAAGREPILAMLRERFSTIGLTTLAIDRIALFRQDDAQSRFRIVNHWQLRATDRVSPAAASP